MPNPAGTWHVTRVSVTHTAVVHATPFTVPVDVGSIPPKLLPSTVMVSLPSAAALVGDMDVTVGDLYVNSAFAVDTSVDEVKSTE